MEPVLAVPNSACGGSTSLGGSTLSCGIFGHSFVSRLSRYLGHMYNYSRVFSSSSVCRKVELNGVSGASFDDMVDFFSTIRGGERFDFIIIDIGTNDICGMVGGKSLAQNIFSCARDLLLHTPYLKHISFNLIRKRLRSLRQRTVYEFEVERLAFNDEIKILCSTSQCITYIKSHLGDDIDQWSIDGIHPSKEFGMSIYVKDIRNQIFFIARRLRS